jgi:hypothetical protein
MPDNNPSAIGRAIGFFKDHLRESVTGDIALNALECAKESLIYSTNVFLFRFDDQYRSDFEEVLVPPYVDCLKNAASLIDQDVKLQCGQDVALLEHSADGIQFVRSRI